MAHTHGARLVTKHMVSPGNLIDLYVTVDVPECEGLVSQILILKA